MPKILKGIFKKSFHNPNSRDSSKYYVVEYLAQTPFAMSALEVLQSFLAQQDALLEALGSMDSLILMENMSYLNIHIWYHVALSVDVIFCKKTIGRTVVDEGASTCVMSISCWKALSSSELVP